MSRPCPSPRPRAAALAIALLLLAQPAGAAVPTRAAITLDGEFDDWLEVLANPLNSWRDGDGSTLPCPDSTDRDCPVPSAATDLARFAWTGDGDRFFFFVERQAGFGDAELIVFFDVDRDGLLENDEPLLLIPLHPGSGATGVATHLYAPAAPGGDPLVGADSWADGFDEPGGLGLSTLPTGELRFGLSDPRRVEIEVAAPVIGLFPRDALDLHVSLASGTATPLPITDNMGRTEGGPGTTGYHELRVTNGASVATRPGAFLELTQVLRNAGNLETTVELSAVSDQAWAVELWTDVDLDGLPDEYLGRDAEGDGRFDGPGDELSPAGDPDGDGVLDTGAIAPGQSFGLVLAQAIPASAEGRRERLTLRARGREAEGQGETVEHRISVGAFSLREPSQARGAPGRRAWFPHALRNDTLQSELLDLWAKSELGWPLQVLLDPLGTGDPAAAQALPDSDASGLPDLLLAPGSEAQLWLAVDVPPDALLGERDGLVLRALLSALPVAGVDDELLAAPELELTPTHLEAEGRALHAAPSGQAWFPHRLTSALPGEEPIALSIVSDLGWPVELFLDPDGDGRPWDAELLSPPALLSLPRNGGSMALLARVQVPAITPTGNVSRIRIEARSGAPGTTPVAVDDDLVAAIVRVYEDAGHAINVNQLPACGTAFAEASGLARSASGYRFVWRSPTGGALRTSPAVTDASGSCADQLSARPGQLGPGWSVEIQEWDGATWEPLDRAIFAVEDAIAVEGLLVAGAPWHLVTELVAAELRLVNRSLESPAENLELFWTLLSPDGSSYLQSDGSFAAYGGSEWTRREELSLPPGAQQQLALAVAEVRFDRTGEHRLELRLRSQCPLPLLVASLGIAVVDDEDGDGLDRLLELASGTDPGDADSDDDGLLDGLDGLDDSDGDGRIDALDCDSDGDGLSDGLEAGVFEPGPFTEPLAGCFRADLWPISQTDPDRADSDGGGVPDGFEDANGNGRIDPGETDPELADDDAACAPAPPPELGGLRLRSVRSGPELRWEPIPLDPCTGYRVLGGTEPLGLVPLSALERQPSFVDARGGGLEDLPLFYLVIAESGTAGRGPSGR